MKTNEAPEKMYVHRSLHLSLFQINITGSDGTNAFIDKACKWLKNNARDYAFVDTDRIGNVADIDLSLVQDFKNYMKGE